MSRQIVELQMDTQLILEAEIVVIPPDQIVYLDALKADTLAARDAANDSEQAAKGSELASKTSELAAKASQDAAKVSEQASQASESAAADSATAAKASETAAKVSEDEASAAKTAAISARNESYQARDAAKTSETAAKGSQDAALASQNAAKTSETAAKASQTASKTSETAARNSENAAKVSEDAAEDSAREAEHAAQDNKHFIEQSWPYPGVIGSVDKDDLIETYPTNGNSSWANLIKFKAREFNIHGRFARITNTTNVILPEAESTAERAVAFDDIFLDWNGTITSHRSITPHRTNTGYNADAIASKHGYSKVQTGLYKKDDTYLLLLCRVARRNQGAYHPVWNPQGSRLMRELGGAVWEWHKWSEGMKEFVAQSTANLFVPAVGGSDPELGYHGSSGKIGGDSGVPDGKSYDAIYADDVTPLYYSAEKITDRQALLFDSFNKAVAGETFMGAEGTTDLVWVAARNKISNREDNISFNIDRTLTDTDLAFTGGTDWTSDLSAKADNRWNEYGAVYLRDSNGNVERFITGSPENSQNYHIHLGFNGEAVFLYRSGGSTSRLANGKIDIYVTARKDSKRPQFLAVDIIGALDAMPQEWLDEGLPGNWLAVGEEGEDLIPDGTEKNFKLSRKCLECYLVLQTNNNGMTWATSGPNWNDSFESEKNAHTTSLLEERVMLFFYRTAANPFELAVTENYLAISRNPLAINGNTGKYSFYGQLTQNMIGKVPVASSSSYIPDSETDGFVHSGHATRIVNNRIIQRNYLYSNRNTHNPFPFSSFGSVNPCAKHLSMLIPENKTLLLQIVYKELKYNGSWGDDNRFNAVFNQSTVTDLNGETVIVGQKRCVLPYHFDGVTH